MSSELYCKTTIRYLTVNLLLGYTPALIASLFGAVFALGLSLGKEFGDIPNSGWSWGDLVEDGYLPEEDIKILRPEIIVENEDL